MSDESENVFSFTWRIENYSFCNLGRGDCLSSPRFAENDSFRNQTCGLRNPAEENGLLNSFNLGFFPRGCWGHGDYISCSVFPDDHKVFSAVAICVIEIISPSGEILCSKKSGTLDKYHYWTVKEAIKINFLINEMKNWTEDTLTIRCCIIDKQQTRQPEIECKARTKFGVDRCSFVWRVSYPDTSDWSERRVFSFNERTPIEVTLSAPEDDVVINIKRELKNSSFVTCRMALVNCKGNDQYSQSASHLFLHPPECCFDSVLNEYMYGYETFKIPTFFTKKALKDNKDILLKNDKFTVTCNFSVTNGINSTEIKYCTLPQIKASSRPDPVSSLRSDLRDMFVSKKHADVKLHVGNQIFPAHKSLLVGRSPVFSTMFDQDMLESQTSVVEIYDTDAKTMNSFLEFIYTGMVNHINNEKASKLLIVAEKYQVLSLKEKCASFLISVLSEENVCELITLADMVGHELLKASSLDFIKSHAENILRSPQWPQWIEKNVKLATEILCTLSTIITSGK